jgi:hypothetical protein
MTKKRTINHVLITPTEFQTVYWEYDSDTDEGKEVCEDVVDFFSFVHKWNYNCKVSPGVTLIDFLNNLYSLCENEGFLQIINSIFQFDLEHHVQSFNIEQATSPKHGQYLILSKLLLNERYPPLKEGVFNELEVETTEPSGWEFTDGFDFHMIDPHDIEYPDMPFGIGFCQMNEIGLLPIQLKTTCTVYTYDGLQPSGSQQIETPPAECYYSLYEVLYGILWEIGFFGDPDEKSQHIKDLQDQMEEIQNQESDNDKR